LGEVSATRLFGRVAAVRGLLVEVAGPVAAMQLGGRLDVAIGGGPDVACEVIGFSGDRALAMPFGTLDGVRRGCEARVQSAAPAVRPSSAWLGRVVDALGRPLDGRGPLPPGDVAYPFRADPPPAHARRRVGAPLDLGVRAINTFLTAARGQRMGIFAGSGVGKSVLLSMMARFTAADVAVIGLVGERGREVQEFLQDDLGPEGLARAVVVVATSDEPALMRRNAAYLTLALASSSATAGRPSFA
jgi:flagellum-specific ATP synthase